MSKTKKAEPKAIACYTHTDKPSGDRWKPGYLAAYCAARAEAIKYGRYSDNLWGWYLSDNLNDTEDAVAVMASDMMERIAYAYWREAVLLWDEGEQ